MATGIIGILLAPFFLGAVQIEACKNAIVQATTFNRDAYREAFNQRIFLDRDGGHFQFGGLGVDNYFNLDVVGRNYFVMENGSQPGTDRLRLTLEGSLDGQDWKIQYPVMQNQNFLGAFMAFNREQLPVGAEFSLGDSSETARVPGAIQKVPRERLASFVEDDIFGREYWKTYLSILDTGAFRLSSDAYGYEDHLQVGFRRYLMDVTTIWGRVARKGNFRRDYTGELGFQNPPEYAFYFKWDIPDEVREREDRVLSAVPRDAVIDTLQLRGAYQRPYRISYGAD